MKELDFDHLVNRIIEEWKLKQDDSRLSNKMSLDEQLEVLKLLKKMRE